MKPSLMRMKPGTPTPMPARPAAPYRSRSCDGRHDIGQHRVAAVRKVGGAGDLVEHIARGIDGGRPQVGTAEVEPDEYSAHMHRHHSTGLAATGIR